MGIYDREYSRRPEPGYHLAAPQSATVQIIIVTFGVYVIQMLLEGTTSALSLKSDWFERPWEFYTLLSYGFLHSLAEKGDEPGVVHILANMFSLWLFGRDVEQRYGRAKFIAFYLTAIVVAGLVWTLCQQLEGGAAAAIGASGATTAVMVVFALNFPQREILFMFAIPMRMWVFGIILVLADAYGAIKQSGNVAFTAHLGGAAYGLLFYKTGWVPALWLVNSVKSLSSRKPRLRVHAPEDEEGQDEDLRKKVDAILLKIHEQGVDKLSWSERRLLEKASRKFQQERK